MLFSRIKLFVLPVLAMLFMGMTASSVHAEDWSNLDKKKQTTLGLYMSAEGAAKYVAENGKKTLFLDVRTPEELAYLGTAAVTDANVPYELMDVSQWDDKHNNFKVSINPDFVAEVTARLEKKGLSKDDAVILMCRSGNRSAGGADLLAAAGYTKVYNMVEGFEGDKAKDGPTKGQRTVNGWKNSGQAWTYSLDKDMMYIK